MAASAKSSSFNLTQELVRHNYLFKELDAVWLDNHLNPYSLKPEKLYSSRPVYTAYRPGEPIDVLHVLVSGGPVVTRSAPLNRIVALTYPGSCFGMRSLPVSYGQISHGFPSLVEAYKTTDVVKLPLALVQALYNDSDTFRRRYDLLFELRHKFEYHLLNCSTYPPQAVAALLRALIYQERSLGNQPTQNNHVKENAKDNIKENAKDNIKENAKENVYTFDLPIEIIALVCQLNHRTVEQVLKGMHRAKLIELAKSIDLSEDTIRVIDPEGLKETYSATRDKVAWWPLK